MNFIAALWPKMKIMVAPYLKGVVVLCSILTKNTIAGNGVYRLTCAMAKISGICPSLAAT